MTGLGMRELLIILLVVLVIFGAKRLRTIGSDLGSAIRGFKTAVNSSDEPGAQPPEPTPNSRLGSTVPETPSSDGQAATRARTHPDA